MEGYSNTEYTEFIEDEDDDDWEHPKSKVKYTILTEEDFVDYE